MGVRVSVDNRGAVARAALVGGRERERHRPIQMLLLFVTEIEIAISLSSKVFKIQLFTVCGTSS